MSDFGALPFNGNWAFKLIEKALQDPNVTSQDIASTLARSPQFQGAIQEVLNDRPNWQPNSRGGEPAQQILGKVIDALNVPGYA